jgi:hypothetical protein
MIFVKKLQHHVFKIKTVYQTFFKHVVFSINDFPIMCEVCKDSTINIFLTETELNLKFHFDECGQILISI